MKSSSHVWQRGHQYYLKLAIPRKIRHHFPSSTGTPRSKIVEPLSDSYEVAKVKAAQKVGRYAGVFARLKAGETMTAEEIAAAVSADLIVNAYLGDTPLSVWLKDLARTQAIARTHSAPLPEGETISAAADAWFAEMQRDPSAAPRKATMDGHRQRVQALIAQRGDVALTSITRATASDFLASLNLSNRTRNNYAMTLAMVFKSAKQRGRFIGDNPFEDQRQKAVGVKRQKFTVDELQAVFNALPREIAPKRHTPDSAVPWAALIAAYSGMRREEVSQLTVADIKTLPANGGTVDCFLVHNGGENHLKSDSSERAVPIHSELVRAGLMQYVKALPKDGLLFPGLTRRTSKDNKIGGRLGEIFNKKLRKLGLKERGILDFHSLRHTAISNLEGSGKRETDVAAVVGHYKEGITFGTYGASEKDIMQKGHPVLKERAGTVEAINYPGFNLPAAR
jgi:integrase